MNLFVFGLGYAIRRLIEGDSSHGLRIAGTVRTPDKARALRAAGIAAHVFEARDFEDQVRGVAGTGLDAVAIAALRDAEVVIAAAPPPADRGIIATLREQSSAIRLRRIVYLSTSAVYGDRGGARVDFTMAATPNGPRGVARLAAEQAWQTFAAEIGATAIALRIAGIYGPGRNVLADLRCGTARRIDKPGHAFNRIHVDDLARFIAAAAKTTEPTVADAADDEAAPQAEVIAYAAGLIGVEVPALMPFDPAGLSEMARSFWAENKRIDNRASKQALGVALRFPSYREGLQALFAAGEGAA